MRTVGQKYKKGTLLRGLHGLCARTAVLPLTVGCVAENAPTPVHPAPAPDRRRPLLHAPPARALDAYARKLGQAHAARAAAAKRWGLAQVPLTAPPPPARKPRLTTRKGFEVDDHEERGLPPVFTTIPTRHKIVFLTIDDGAEKDPAFLRMMIELKIPYTAFLSDYLVKEDYGYFRKMRDLGVVLNNHTLRHRYLPVLSYDSQKTEICGMQDVIKKRYGTRPALFRPPYGTYDTTKLRAAADCGVSVVVLWTEGTGERQLRAGDIVPVGLPLVDRTVSLLRQVQERGLSVARLEDYLQ